MAIDVYLQIDGIKGESMGDKHKDWIEVSGIHWGVYWLRCKQHLYVAASTESIQMPTPV